MVQFRHRLTAELVAGKEDGRVGMLICSVALSVHHEASSCTTLLSFCRPVDDFLVNSIPNLAGFHHH